ncbi:MAG: FtsX-like permease family protein [Burkholderiales bacterium]
MHIRPILSSLLRHKIAAALIVLEIAITFAIICNAVFLVANRLERAAKPSGLVESNLLRIQITSVGASARQNERAQTQVDLTALRELAGVKHATVTSQMPFGNSSTSSSVGLAPDFGRQVISPSAYYVGEDFLATTGLRLIAGRDFSPGEYVDATDVLEREPATAVPAIILNRQTAERLFPGGQALGKSVGVYDSQTVVVGVVDELIPPNSARSSAPFAMILPMRVTHGRGEYLLRVEPGRQDDVLKAAVATLNRVGPGRLVRAQQRFEVLRDRYFKQDMNMAILLGAVCAALLVVTALGIVGLASFWVQQRTRMIGTRRALGATRGQIMRYFQTENLLLTGIGIVLGVGGAYAINQLLMTHYELARLPVVYLPVGAVLLVALGQIAVFGPARRAAALPPVAVMRGA